MPLDVFVNRAPEGIVQKANAYLEHECGFKWSSAVDDR